MSPFDHPVAYALFGVAFLACCVIVAMFVGILRDAASTRPKNAAPAPESQPVQGRAVTLCSVQWCPSKDAPNSWKTWPLCEVHFADLMNAGAVAVRDATGDILAEEAQAFLRRAGGAS